MSNFHWNFRKCTYWNKVVTKKGIIVKEVTSTRKKQKSNYKSELIKKFAVEISPCCPLCWHLSLLTDYSCGMCRGLWLSPSSCSHSLSKTTWYSIFYGEWRCPAPLLNVTGNEADIHEIRRTCFWIKDTMTSIGGTGFLPSREMPHWGIESRWFP